MPFLLETTNSLWILLTVGRLIRFDSMNNRELSQDIPAKQKSRFKKMITLTTDTFSILKQMRNYKQTR
jgi:hypothetical protein